MPGAGAPALLPTAVHVFGEGSTAMGGHLTATHAADWLPWTPSAKPIPEQHPLGHTCIDGTLRLPGPLDVSMCLSESDHVSKQLALNGRWRDCKALVQEWHQGGSDDHDNVAVELGANIGACTLELLLLTNASVAAFEPSPINLFYLTRTLSRLAARWPSITRRVAVFPIGAGDTAGRLQMSYEEGNLGNSRFASQRGAKFVRGGGKRVMTKGALDVYPLDSIFPTLPKPARMAKFDVCRHPAASYKTTAFLVGVLVAAPDASAALCTWQIEGFECRALQGATTLLLSGSIQSLVVETSRLLKLQRCSAGLLRAFLRLAGYAIAEIGGGEVAYAMGRTNEKTTKARVLL